MIIFDEFLKSQLIPERIHNLLKIFIFLESKFTWNNKKSLSKLIKIIDFYNEIPYSPHIIPTTAFFLFFSSNFSATDFETSSGPISNLAGSVIHSSNYTISLQ